jgi:hypothetical protein
MDSREHESNWAKACRAWALSTVSGIPSHDDASIKDASGLDRRVPNRGEQDLRTPPRCAA